MCRIGEVRHILFSITYGTPMGAPEISEFISEISLL